MISWLNHHTRPYIIAEAGVNHNGSIQHALELIEAATDAGADAVKFQAFSAAQLTTVTAPKADYQRTAADNHQSQQQMLRQLQLETDDFRKLHRHCADKGIDFMVTPFSASWVRQLNNLPFPAWKIGSGHIGSCELLRAVGRTTRPVILSTGMSEIAEVESAITTLSQAGTTQIALLHCVSLYPTQLIQVNLFAIGTLTQHFDLPTGFSDHTTDTDTGALAVAAGAQILEKHLTLDRSLPGPDHAMSLTPAQFVEYVRLARRSAAACGRSEKRPHPDEQQMRRIARLSVVTTRTIRAGQTISVDMLTEKRPGTGIPADRLEQLVGRVSKVDIPADHLISWDDLQPCRQTD